MTLSDILIVLLMLTVIVAVSYVDGWDD